MVVGIASSGCSSRTSLKVDISATGLSITSLSLDVGWGGSTRHTTSLPANGGPPQLPGTALVLLPDESTLIDVTLHATDDDSGAVLVNPRRP